MSNILPNLFLGSMNDANNSYPKYDHIISLLAYGQKLYLPINNHSIYQINDDYRDNLFKIIYQVADQLEYILYEKKNVLIHCHAGVSRAPSMVIGYLMIKKNMSYENAYMHVKCRRNIICPKPNFKKPRDL